MHPDSRKSYAFRIPTQEGVFTAVFSELGLRYLHFPGRRTEAAVTCAAGVPAKVQRWQKLALRAVTRVLTGRKAGKLPPLDLSGDTSFQKSVWAALLGIQPGQTLSYGAVAAAIGKPKASRAVGGACGANPIPVLIPCHRVLAAKHRLGGFSGGLDWKKRLLAREGSWQPAE
jgi:O-6-methylguanine DNA methyltransferase